MKMHPQAAWNLLLEQVAAEQLVAEHRIDHAVLHGVFRWFEYQDGPGPFDSLYWIKGQSLQVDLETDKPVCACLEGACTLMSDVVTQYDFNLAEDAFARVMARLAKMIRAGDPTFPDRELSLIHI